MYQKKNSIFAIICAILSIATTFWLGFVGILFALGAIWFGFITWADSQEKRKKHTMYATLGIAISCIGVAIITFIVLSFIMAAPVASPKDTLVFVATRIDCSEAPNGTSQQAECFGEKAVVEKNISICHQFDNKTLTSICIASSLKGSPMTNVTVVE